MKLIKLTDKYKDKYIEYCNKYGGEHDESYLPESNFEIRDDEPVIIALDESGNIIGAAALMLHPEYREIRKGRFIIFHSKENLKELYKALLNEIVKYCDGIENIYAFLPNEKTVTAKLWLQLGFEIERYSFLMLKFTDGDEEANFPEGIYLTPVKTEKDRTDFCDIINICFANIGGHKRMTTETLDSWYKEKFNWAEGILILKDKDKSIGTVRLQTDDDSYGRSLFLESLAVLPGHQGKGLASNILKSALKTCKDMGLNRLYLTVNAENESAANLYLRQGFKKIKTYVCYNLNLNNLKA